jgi:2-polyprenyl-3-methyl-5-hydroxy-6-metoxy-1,4-benzoquinol methylase
VQMEAKLSKEYGEKLERIAAEYHGGHLEDMWIEKAGQDYEWPWIESHIPANAHVLDLGYGDGHSFNNLKELTLNKNLRVTVIEGAPSLVDVAQNNSNSSMTIVNGFFENFESHLKFDVIIASHVLEHVDNPIELLIHLKRFLADDGKILGIVPNSESIHRRLSVLLNLQERLDTLSKRDHLVGHQRVYSLSSLKNDFYQAGLILSESRGFFLKPFSNSQLIPFGTEIIDSLLKVSEELSVEICANIGFVCKLPPQSN